jgi:hypothetical protein
VTSPFDPDVWSGRALQDAFVGVAKVSGRVAGSFNWATGNYLAGSQNAAGNAPSAAPRRRCAGRGLSEGKSAKMR